ncbi:hypothetical protein FOC1_g10008139 [Fusarium oxysporum f. sp. cubense race 1]|uniref:Uncharacterized protein n=4 Tax=Fusarium oxysporum TaxID=5507 RepID=N4U3Z7_FUSC1|nr:hypothetical protein FOC1_g10008139 [Fusarium oxysporum f. sp. cubense race 1]
MPFCTRAHNNATNEKYKEWLVPGGAYNKLGLIDSATAGRGWKSRGNEEWESIDKRFPPRGSGRAFRARPGVAAERPPVRPSLLSTDSWVATLRALQVPDECSVRCLISSGTR